MTSAQQRTKISASSVMKPSLTKELRSWSGAARLARSRRRSSTGAREWIRTDPEMQVQSPNSISILAALPLSVPDCAAAASQGAQQDKSRAHEYARASKILHQLRDAQGLVDGYARGELLPWGNAIIPRPLFRLCLPRNAEAKAANKKTEHEIGASIIRKLCPALWLKQDISEFRVFGAHCMSEFRVCL